MGARRALLAAAIAVSFVAAPAGATAAGSRAPGGRARAQEAGPSGTTAPPDPARPRPEPGGSATPAANDGPAPPSAVDPADPITDPRLDAAVAAGGRLPTESTAGQVPVEVFTEYEEAVSARIVELGGRVTGSLPGVVVQGTVPATAAEQLALTAGVREVRWPRLVNRLPSAEAVGFGPTVGDEVAATNVDEWHQAGLTGAGAKVGIVDYFSMSLWNPSEHGPTPSVGNGRMFCRDEAQFGLCTGGGAINGAAGDPHGVAVAEIVKDMAPDADLYIATVGTVSDLRAAIDWFADNGVRIMTRSLGAAYDGPGDGTGALDSAVDYAAAKGLTWFNSGGNDAYRGYLRVTVPAALPVGGYVDFNDDDIPANMANDQLLRIDSAQSSGCREVYLDGVRWSNDWYLPAAQRDDYQIEVYQAGSTIGGAHNNPTTLIPVDVNPFASGVQNVIDTNQQAGAPPLEGANWGWCTTSGVSYIKIRKNKSGSGSAPDTIEIALGSGDLEGLMYDVAGSGAKPVVDSRNPALVAVGALSGPDTNSIAYYSSQGPTNDGRVKPDVTAPSCVYSTIYSPSCFAGTSAASPAAAGLAAVLLARGLALPGEGLAALVKHVVTDLGTPGADSTFGTGKLRLPAAPADPAAAAAAQFRSVTPERILDTRPGSAVGPSGLIGVKSPQAIVDLPVLGAGPIPPSGVSAVAVNITSVSSGLTTYLQGYPTLQGSVAGTSTLNISAAGLPRPNFAIVQVGEAGSISVYVHAGGHVVVDVLGYFEPAASSSVADGRFVSIVPERWMDTQDDSQQPAPPFSGPRNADAGETVVPVKPGGSAVPDTGVRALVVNLTADVAAAGGFLRAQPNAASGLGHSNVNYEPGAAYANTAIVPLGVGNAISVFTSQSARVIVDVVGYITGDTAPSATTGLFVAVTPGRNYDSRVPAPVALPANTSRDTVLTGQSPPAAVVPSDASAVSANLTAVDAQGGGYLTLYPTGTGTPLTSSVNYGFGQTVANAALTKLGSAGAVTASTSQTTHYIVDVSGYFTG